jgi:hypothetical protein
VGTFDEGVRIVGGKFERHFIRPLIVPIGAFIVLAAIIITIGQSLYSMYEAGRTELKRPELWTATLLALLILGVCAFIATRPDGSLGPLDRELAIGKKEIFAAQLQPVDIYARHGNAGTTADITAGYILYARSGQLGTVIEVLKGVEEHGQIRKALLYAQGSFGASDELWIPIEAVSAVFPETHSAFLAIKGDETEAFGWNRAPEGFSRKAKPEEPKLY